MSTAPPIFSHPNSLKIFGPAGAGKTRELINILAEHIADGDFHLVEGIIVSFTRAASADIARRVNPDGEPGRYHCTLHALCKRYYGFEGGIAEPRLREFFKEVGIEYNGSFQGDGEEWAPMQEWRPSEGGLMMNFFSQCRNRLLSIEEGLELLPPSPEMKKWWTPENMNWVWDRYVGWKEEHGLVDFTDMLEHAVLNPPQGQWAFFVLDEAQDCTPLQWMVAQAFAARAEYVYIGGDDDQAIYSWAGATPHEFLAADTSLEDVLRINHRSGAVIVEAAQQFIRRNKDRKDKAMQAANRGGVIGEVGTELPELNINESTFVMARAHYLLDGIQQELTELNFPFVDKRGSYGVAGKAATQYHRFRRLALGQALTVEEWRLLMDGIPSTGPWLMRGSKVRIKELSPELQKSSYVRARDLLAYGASQELVDAILAHSLDPLARIDKDRMAYLKGVADRYGPEYLDEKKAGAICSVGPIHAFKGLECDHAVIHEGMSPAAANEGRLNPEPERRVFYVGITRARSRVSWINSGPVATRFQEVL